MKRQLANTLGLSKKVLVVDDNELMRVFLSDSLSLIGFKVETAEDGFEGFELFSHSRFDLVITDYDMPGIDGCYLTDLIKKRCSHTPVLMITGRSQDEVLEKITASQVDWLMFKPFEWEDLLHAVQLLLVNAPSELSSTEPQDLVKT